VRIDAVQPGARHQNLEGAKHEFSPGASERTSLLIEKVDGKLTFEHSVVKAQGNLGS
jgi:hypothetical protein